MPRSAGSRAPTVRPCRGPRRPQARPHDAPPARGCRPAPRGRSGCRCPHSGRSPGQNPPQAEESHDVVDPHPPGMAQDRAQHVPGTGRTPRSASRSGPPRRLAPVLTDLVVRVGRGADRDAAGEGIGQPQESALNGRDAGPRGRGMTSTDMPAGGLPLNAGELFVDHPLQRASRSPPHRRSLAAQFGNRAATWVPEAPPARSAPASPCFSARHTRWRSPEQALTTRVSQNAGKALSRRGGPRQGEERAQSRHLGRPDRVAVDRVGLYPASW